MLSQKTLSLNITDFEPSQYERLAEVFNANFPDNTISAAEWRSDDERSFGPNSKFLLKRYTCRNEAGLPVAFGELAHVADMFHPKKFWIRIWVDPTYQCRGAGRRMFDKLATELESLGAVVVWTGSKENLPVRTAFFERRGFVQKMTAWESRLDVTSFDFEKFRDYSSRVEKQGIRITTLAEERARGGEESLRKLHVLVQDITRDMPSIATFTPSSYEEWYSWQMKNPRLLPEGWMIAMDGDQYVGMSMVWCSDTEPEQLGQGDTGVVRAYRGKGIAIALKVAVVDYARRNGYGKLKTWNASNNAPMLAVNTKLGFKREVGWTTLEKSLD